MPSLSTSVSVDDETMPEQIGGGGGAAAATSATLGLFINKLGAYEPGLVEKIEGIVHAVEADDERYEEAFSEVCEIKFFAEELQSLDEPVEFTLIMITYGGGPEGGLGYRFDQFLNLVRPVKAHRDWGISWQFSDRHQPFWYDSEQGPGNTIYDDDIAELPTHSDPDREAIEYSLEDFLDVFDSDGEKRQELIDERVSEYYEANPSSGSEEDDTSSESESDSSEEEDDEELSRSQLHAWAAAPANKAAAAALGHVINGNSSNAAIRAAMDAVQEQEQGD